MTVPKTAMPTTAIEVAPSGPVRARLRAPASKSVTNRLLVTAALASGTSRLVLPLDSDDTRACRRLVGALGVTVRDEPDAWIIIGTAGRLRSPKAPVDVGLSGTTMRFGAALAALVPDDATITGAPPLLRRPVGPLVAALRELGAAATDRDGCPPVTAGGGIAGGAVAVDATTSSQYASALLLVAPYARQAVTVRVTGEPALIYVELTAATMGEWGAAVERTGPAEWRVAPGHYRAREVCVSYDASAAAHLFALAAATNGVVTVANAVDGTLQPDAGLPSVLARMGASVVRDGDALTVAGSPQLRAVDVDLRAMPDQVVTIAALAALADGTSRLRGVAVARGHETDRLAALAAELRKLGVPVAESPDGLTISGGHARGPARLDTYNDHRLAMAFAAIGARLPGVVIEEPWCVTKTYPGFWCDLAAAGVTWRPA